MSVKTYNACIYARLSRDDGDKLESDSITNQKALIREFIKRHPEIRIVSEKTDDGFSGVNFERPAFQEMMDDIRSGKVNCVVVKDLSRFGRNYIEAGNYIERVFPFMGVRFIAINDNYDSLDKSQSDSLVIPFKNLINDAYCKDISVKIRTQLDIKRKKGQFIGAFAAYGYLKDENDHNKLVVDSYASEVVRAIFKWKLHGMSQGRIADKLNLQGVLSPLEYKISLGMKIQTNFRVNKKALWSPVAVTRILTNEIYTGVLIQGKSGTPNYKVKKVMLKDEAEWIRVENTHTAIIDKADFEMVQNILQKDIRIAPYEQAVYPFSGYLKCADCGQNMVRKHYKTRYKEYTYFICSTKKANKGCSTHSIDETALTEAVLHAVRSQIDMVMELERIMEILESVPEKQQNIFNYDAQIVKLKEEIERYESFRLKLYENLQDGLLSKDEYFLFRINGICDAMSIIEAKYIQNASDKSKYIFSLSSRDFEILIAALYKKMGYKVTLSDMEYVITQTKTGCGVRDLPMTQGVYECFQRILKARRRPKVEPMIGKKIGFLFLDKNGMPKVAGHWEKYFKHMVGKYNRTHKVQLPGITPHVCRHTYCTNMARAGMNPKSLQYLMGHSEVATTMDVYTHFGYEEAKVEVGKVSNK